MAGTIVVDRLESDASYASSINIASPIQISNTITGNVNFDNGTLFVDSVGNAVCVGTTTPLATAANRGNLTVNGSSAAIVALGVANSVKGYLYQDSTTMYLTNSGTGSMDFETGSSMRMRIDSSGRITKPSQPAFIAYVQNEASLAYQTTHQLSQYYNLTDINRGSCYNTSNGRFTAPVTGIYQFNFKYYWYPISSTEAYFYVNGSAWMRFQMMYNYSSNTNPGGYLGTALINLNANDYVELYGNFNTVGGTNASIWNGGPRASCWSGFLVG
jgi:hypothetical protein